MSTLQDSLDLITRGAEEVLKLEELEARLKAGKTLRVKAGDDIDCRPYLCPAGETACRPKCASDSECVPAGEVADPDNALVCDNDGACVPPPDAPTLPSCGVARDVPGGGSFASAALGLLLGALVRRRRARRT